MTNAPLAEAVSRFAAGTTDRRAFIARATALGVSASAAVFLANTVSGQESTPVPGAAMRPDAGTDGQERGGGGQLAIMQWQAPTSLSPHLVTGSKDFLAAMLVMEPLIHYSADSAMVPNLVTEIPTIENGLLAQDLTSVTLKLLPGITWSDGEPLTADDVAFTTEWVKDPANNSVNQGVFAAIASTEVVDDLTITVNFTDTNPFWFDPFTGIVTGTVYPRHIIEATGHDAFMSAPIGTGPYKVDSFSANDSVTYSINENYREANKPWFGSVQLKGGTDAASAARSVLQTGDFDFAWKLQVEPDVLASMISEDGPGVLMPFTGAAVERVNLNFSDPNKEVDGQRSEMNTPHPFFTDIVVREAVSLAIDRELIATEFYGNGQPAAINLLNGDPMIESPNTSWGHDPDRANQILDEAGWTLEGDVRSKDGVELSVVFAASVNPVRQKSQAVIKANLEAIGMRVAIESIDSAIFFDTAVGNDQNYAHFYWDMNMLQSVPNSPRSMQSMETWYAGPNRENIAQRSNGWAGQNTSRYVSEAYDSAFEAARVATDAEELAAQFIAMNDDLILNFVLVPLVVAGEPRAVSKRLRADNIALGPFSGDYWNIANWNEAE